VSGGYDVAVAGASLAGCATARLFALAGARVALVERSPDPSAYKVTCTHQIQSSAVPAIERLGLAPVLAGAGAARPRAASWTPYGGWLLFPSDAPAGYGLSRRQLDPIVRELAAGTPGVDYRPGERVVAVLGGDDGRVEGFETESRDGARRSVRAPLTVAARVWMLDPDAAAVFPNEDGITLVAVVPHRARLPEFRRDPEAAYARMAGSLPEGPRLEDAERVSKLLGRRDMPNEIRVRSRPGLAFVGDAALAADPLFGVGCGWAFQSAEWLVEHARAAVLERGDLEPALARYRRAFLRRLGPHHLQISDYSTGRRMRPNERLAFGAAARDPAVAATIEAFATRRTGVLPTMDPRFVARALIKGR
jgi:menaquinone-9 beta-reductase